MDPILSGAAAGIFAILLFMNGHLIRIAKALEKIAGIEAEDEQRGPKP